MSTQTVIKTEPGRLTTAPQQFTSLELENLTRPGAPKKRRAEPAQWVLEQGGSFIPLELETRPTVDTETAAHHLHLAPQTMRLHACRETGPIRPLRIPGLAKLHWKTADIRKLLGVA